MNLIRVALDVPVARLFDYRCDDVAAQIGMRVLVPFGRQKLIGIIVGKPDVSEAPEAKIKRAYALADSTPLLRPADLRLLEFAAEYYVHPLGSVVMATLPAALRRVRTREQAPAAYELTAAGSAVHLESLPPRARSDASCSP